MREEACFLVAQPSLLCPLCGHAQRRGGEIIEESRLAVVLSSVLCLRLCWPVVCVCVRACVYVCVNQILDIAWEENILVP